MIQPDKTTLTPIAPKTRNAIRRRRPAMILLITRTLRVDTGETNRAWPKMQRPRCVSFCNAIRPAIARSLHNGRIGVQTTVPDARTPGTLGRHAAVRISARLRPRGFLGSLATGASTTLGIFAATTGFVFAVTALFFSRRTLSSSRISVWAAFATIPRDASGTASSAEKKACVTGLVPRGKRVDTDCSLIMVLQCSCADRC
jgi:hypothetical protein